MGEDFIKGAEKIATNKYVLAGVAVVALVGGYYFISSRLASIASAGAADSMTSGMLPSTVSYLSPLSAIGGVGGGASGGETSGGGATGSGSGNGTAAGTGGAAGTGSGTAATPADDTYAALQAELAISANNLQLGLAQLQTQTNIAQLNQQVQLAGLQAQEQGQSLSVVSSVMQTVGNLFQKNGNGTTANQNFNGAFSVDGVPVSFSVNQSNYKGGDSQGFFTAVNKELGQNAGIVGQTSGATNAPAGTATGPKPVSVPNGQAFGGGIGSVVDGARAHLA